MIRLVPMLPSQTDGILFADWKLEGRKLVRRIVQPGEDAILSANSERRKDPDSVRKLDWAKLVMRIPENRLALLFKKYPDLASAHAHTSYLAWLKFHNSSESEPYRLQPRNLKRG